MILHVAPTPPSTHFPGLDPRLESICLKAMAKKPDNRFASMGEFAGALQAWLDEPERGSLLPLSSSSPSVSTLPRAREEFAEATQPWVDDPVTSGSPSVSQLPRAKEAGGRRLIRIGIAAAVAFTALFFGIIYVANNQGRIKEEAPRSVPPDIPKRDKMPESVAEAPPRPKIEETLTTNTLGMKLNLIPAGEFDMGSDASDPDASDDEKVNGKKHHVRITRPFYLGTTEVTVGQFREFVEGSNYKTEAERDGQGVGAGMKRRASSR